MKTAMIVMAMALCLASSVSAQRTTVKNLENRHTASVMLASNDGTFMRTSNSVTIYSESGTCKGAYSIYLHHGQKYILFCNSWVCIQGRTRFGYNGNWYIIR